MAPSQSGDEHAAQEGHEARRVKPDRGLEEGPGKTKKKVVHAYISKLPHPNEQLGGLSLDFVHEVFSKCGTVVRVSCRALPASNGPHEQTLHAMVQYATADQAAEAVAQLDGGSAVDGELGLMKVYMSQYDLLGFATESGTGDAAEQIWWKTYPAQASNADTGLNMKLTNFVGSAVRTPKVKCGTIFIKITQLKSPMSLPLGGLSLHQVRDFCANFGSVLRVCCRPQSLPGRVGLSHIVALVQYADAEMAGLALCFLTGMSLTRNVDHIISTALSHQDDPVVRANTELAWDYTVAPRPFVFRSKKGRGKVGKERPEPRVEAEASAHEEPSGKEDLPWKAWHECKAANTQAGRSRAGRSRRDGDATRVILLEVSNLKPGKETPLGGLAVEKLLNLLRSRSPINKMLFLRREDNSFFALVEYSNVADATFALSDLKGRSVTGDGKFTLSAMASSKRELVLRGSKKLSFDFTGEQPRKSSWRDWSPPSQHAAELEGCICILVGELRWPLLHASLGGVHVSQVRELCQQCGTVKKIMCCRIFTNDSLGVGVAKQLGAVEAVVEFVDPKSALTAGTLVNESLTRDSHNVVTAVVPSRKGVGTVRANTSWCWDRSLPLAACPPARVRCRGAQAPQNDGTGPRPQGVSFATECRTRRIGRPQPLPLISKGDGSDDESDLDLQAAEASFHVQVQSAGEGPS